MTVETFEAESECLLQIGLAKETNLKGHITWFEYLSGPEFKSDTQKRYQKKSNRSDLVKLAREVVEEEIYVHGQSTGRIAKSFRAEAAEGAMGGINVFSDPDIAPSKAGKNPGQFSYAAFFEKPLEDDFNSFIKAEDPLDSKRYRPFFDQMTEVIRDWTTDQYLEAFMAQVKSRQPKSGS